MQNFTTLWQLLLWELLWWERKKKKIPLTPMGDLATGSAHARRSAQPPINMSGNFPGVNPCTLIGPIIPWIATTLLAWPKYNKSDGRAGYNFPHVSANTVLLNLPTCLCSLWPSQWSLPYNDACIPLNVSSSTVQLVTLSTWPSQQCSLWPSQCVLLNSAACDPLNLDSLFHFVHIFYGHPFFT